MRSGGLEDLYMERFHDLEFWWLGWDLGIDFGVLGGGFGRFDRGDVGEGCSDSLRYHNVRRLNCLLCNLFISFSNLL